MRYENTFKIFLFYRNNERKLHRTPSVDYRKKKSKLILKKDFVDINK